jgi:antitoxin component YwqK of YwqJK toxin-antitoxin module
VQEHFRLDSNQVLNGPYSVVCNEKTLITGYYQNGNPEGKWIYLNTNGQKVITGFYLKGLKNGIWNYYKNDQLICQLNYVNNLLNGDIKVYKSNDKSETIASYKNGILVRKMSDYHEFENGFYFLVEQMPLFFGEGILVDNGLSSDNIKNESTIFHSYLKSQLDKISISSKGNVYVEFTVDLIGAVTDVKIIKGFTPSENEEILNIFRALPYFEPGFLNRLPAKVKYTQPIKFE